MSIHSDNEQFGSQRTTDAIIQQARESKLERDAMSKVRDIEGLGYEVAAEAEDVVASTDEEGFVTALIALLETATDYEPRIKTYEDGGYLTYDKGFVIELPSGSEFQITVKQSATSRLPLLG